MLLLLIIGIAFLIYFVATHHGDPFKNNIGNFVVNYSESVDFERTSLNDKIANSTVIVLLEYRFGKSDYRIFKKKNVRLSYFQRKSLINLIAEMKSNEGKVSSGVYFFVKNPPILIYYAACLGEIIPALENIRQDKIVSLLHSLSMYE